MASASIPSTPTAQIVRRPVATPPTGSWEHPKFDEIARRQSQATFSDRNVKRILWNGGALSGTWIITWATQQTPWLSAVRGWRSEFASWSILFLRIYLVFNVLLALAPLLLPTDELADIPLTPSQRSLLGLHPSVTPTSTPTTAFVTPPRYRESTTPRTRSTPGSPLSRPGMDSPSSGRGHPSSPYSAYARPLVHQLGEEGGKTLLRRSSYGSPSLLGRSSATVVDSSLIGHSSSVGLPAAPSPPPRAKGASLGLNSKWLYERTGSGSMGGASVFR